MIQHLSRCETKTPTVLTRTRWSHWWNHMGFPMSVAESLVELSGHRLVVLAHPGNPVALWLTSSSRETARKRRTNPHPPLIQGRHLCGQAGSEQNHTPRMCTIMHNTQQFQNPLRLLIPNTSHCIRLHGCEKYAQLRAARFRWLHRANRATAPNGTGALRGGSPTEQDSDGTE